MHLKKAGSIFPRISFAAPLLRQTASLSPRLKVENMNEQNYLEEALCRVNDQFSFFRSHNDNNNNNNKNNNNNNNDN